MDNSPGIIREKITAYISNEHFDGSPEELKGDMPLISSGIIDSITVLLMVDFLEETFQIEFEPHEVDHTNLDSIDLMVEFILSKLDQD